MIKLTPDRGRELDSTRYEPLGYGIVFEPAFDTSLSAPLLV